MPTRRSILATLASAPLSARAAQGNGPAAQASAALVALERHLGGRVGVCAVDIGNGLAVAHRPDARFAMQSTFKWLLAAFVLHRAAAGGPALDDAIDVTADAIVGHSDQTRGFVGTVMTRGALCAAMMSTSDNGAANLLLRDVGGPAALTAYIRALGDVTTRQDTAEPGPPYAPGDARNTTTPRAMLALMRRVWLGDALPENRRAQLLRWLRSSVVGAYRLRAGVPQPWVEGDRTGTGNPGVINDLAIFWPEGVHGRHAPILIASLLSESNASLADLEAAQARIGAIVARAFA